MNSKKVYIVLHIIGDSFDSVIIDSAWQDKELAERRLDEIKGQIYKSFPEDETEEIFWEWGIIKAPLNSVKMKKVY